MTQCIQSLSMGDFIVIMTVGITMIIGLMIGIWTGKKTKPVVMIQQPEQKKTKRGVSSLPPKFKSPTGDVWHGKGRPPAWMKELIATGRSQEEFENPEWTTAKGMNGTR